MPNERWRKPAGVIDIQHKEAEGIWLPDGRVQVGVAFIVDEETAERMRLGYLCAKCLEPFEHAWPERCPVCGCPVRRDQAAFFAAEFGGEAEPAKGFDLEDETEAMKAEIKREGR